MQIAEMRGLRLQVRCICQLVSLGLLAVFGPSSASAQISLYTAIEMALRNSPQVRMSAADVQRAEAGVKESIDVYRPSFLLGSSLGYSYGFPIGQPEVFSLSGQSLAFSFSQPDYVRSARRGLEAAQLSLKDTRQQVILDTALDYIELAKVNQQVAALNQEDGFTRRLIDIERERVDAGRDSKVELAQARLLGAQIDLRRIHFLGQADLLREKLAHLTGFSASELSPDAQSIPAPEPSEDESPLDSSVMRSNTGVQAAYANARSKLYVAFGDSRQNNRPTVGFFMNYGLFANFNNYSTYYLHFQNNNFGIGLQINIPLLDASRRDKARQSSAEAAHAAAEADQTRDQTSEQVLRLQKSLGELAAAERVAALQSELAQDQLEAVTTEIQTGGGNPNTAPLTPKDEQQAHINERNRYVDMLDAKFQLTEAQLSLLRALGKIEDWAKTIPATKP
jgi:outer membrane protein TolC